MEKEPKEKHSWQPPPGWEPPPPFEPDFNLITLREGGSPRQLRRFRERLRQREAKMTGRASDEAPHSPGDDSVPPFTTSEVVGMGKPDDREPTERRPPGWEPPPPFEPDFNLITLREGGSPRKIRRYREKLRRLAEKHETR